MSTSANLISDGRYDCHLEDIARFETLPQPLDSTQAAMLERMKAEVAVYEARHPEISPSGKGSGSIDILETVCFPRGCKLVDTIDAKVLPYVAEALVTKLKAAGMSVAEWTRGAELLEEPFLTKVKSVVCRQCAITTCIHNPNHSPLGQDDPLRTAFNIGYGDRTEFHETVLDQILPLEDVRSIEEKGLKVFRWMTTSRNKIHICIDIGDQSIRYSADKKRGRSDFSINNEDRPVPTSITDICSAVKEITQSVLA